MILIYFAIIDHCFAFQIDLVPICKIWATFFLNQVKFIRIAFFTIFIFRVVFFAIIRAGKAFIFNFVKECIYRTTITI